ncbi:MAG: hypothetical protein P3A28_00425 [Gemmatimonadota bacterium]|nr:hypothetical protein [Gemmatimonadota bacterium]
MSEPQARADQDPVRLALPEFTRSLRGFASVRALGTREHDLIFGPLVAARRSAVRVLAPEARAAAFDADRLRRSLLEAVEAIAADRAGADPARARAYSARIEERAAPALAALAELAVAAAALRAAPADARAARWGLWCNAVQMLFDAVDQLWLVLDEVAPRRRPA